jgi:hypothetical protein
MPAYPAIELQVSPDILAALDDGVAAFATEPFGDGVLAVWLRTAAGLVIHIAVAPRTVQPMFEVFGLDIASFAQLHDRWRDWTAPTLPADWPEPLRALATTRPAEPAVPASFIAWPPATRVDVLRRAEFVIADVEVGPTFGNHPALQAAERPGHVPDEASASCEVAVGLLFSGAGHRMLIAADWTPLRLLVSQEDAAIVQYLAACEQVPLATYLRRL